MNTQELALPLNQTYQATETTATASTPKPRPSIAADPENAFPKTPEVDKQKERDEKIARILEDQQPGDKSVRFNVDPDNKKTQVQIIDQKTQEVIRSFPSEEMLQVMDRIEDYLGITLDQQA